MTCYQQKEAFRLPPDLFFANRLREKESRVVSRASALKFLMKLDNKKGISDENLPRRTAHL
jgi:hypothetical protein